MSGEQSEFRVHGVVEYELELWRYGGEKEFIRRKLEENSGNIKRTAERIRIQRSNLYKKIEKYGLSRHD